MERGPPVRLITRGRLACASARLQPPVGRGVLDRLAPGESLAACRRPRPRALNRGKGGTSERLSLLNQSTVHTVTKSVIGFAQSIEQSSLKERELSCELRLRAVHPQQGVGGRRLTKDWLQR